jgi:hypothetical protein
MHVAVTDVENIRNNARDILVVISIDKFMLFNASIYYADTKWHTFVLISIVEKQNREQASSSYMHVMCAMSNNKYTNIIVDNSFLSFSWFVFLIDEQCVMHV